MAVLIEMACLLHDIAIAGLLSANRGYWGAQLVVPYAGEEVSWAIREARGATALDRQAAGAELITECDTRQLW